MTQEDATAFRAELAIVFAAKGRPIEALTAEAYWRVLSMLPLAEFRAACALYIASTDEFPNPGKILALAPGTATHVQAWAEIRSEIRAGRGNDARVSQRHHVAVRMMGGWHQLGQSDSASLDKRAYDFREAWESAGHKVAHHEREHPPTNAPQITGQTAPTVKPRMPSDELLWRFPNGTDATIEDFRAKYHQRFAEWSDANKAYEIAKGSWDAAHPVPPPSGQIYGPGMTYLKDRQWFGDVTKKFFGQWPREMSIEERAERAWSQLGHLSRRELVAAYEDWNKVTFPSRGPTYNELLDRVDGGHDKAARNAQMKSNAKEAKK